MKSLALTSMVALSVLGLAGTASAQCQETFAATVSGPPPLPYNSWRLEVVGARVTTRGELGFIAFTMADRFEIEQTPPVVDARAGIAPAEAVPALRSNRAEAGDIRVSAMCTACLPV